jgi:predicted TIM-barrel fold metal-dependent hydrolase
MSRCDWSRRALGACFLAAALAFSSSAAAETPAPAAAASRPDPSVIPLVDHHLHLLSAAGSASKLVPVQIPPAVQNLLERRQSNWDKAGGLAPLYTSDSTFFLNILNRGWLKGPAEISAFLATGYTGLYRYKPMSFRAEGPVAHLTGFLVDPGESDSHWAFFHLELKETSGTWQIASETQILPGPAVEPPFTAAELVQRLDEAGIRRGVVLSDAYYFALSPQMLPGEYEKVRAENDWTAQQVAAFPDRLVAFCSFNPLRDYALTELERCAASNRFTGIKLHLNAAQINYQSPSDVAKAVRVMQAANKHKLPLIIHVRSSDHYGREDAEVFLRQIVAAAPDVTVQIAHLWGGETFSPSALKVYADAVANGDPVARNVYFDISGFGFNGKPEDVPSIVAAIRRIGLKRILYASDGPPKASLEAFLKLPLTEEEFRTIAGNVAPYLRPAPAPAQGSDRE